MGIASDTMDSGALDQAGEEPSSRARPRVTPPVLYCPFPAAVHADADRIEEGTIAWMKRYGYIRTLREEETVRNAAFGIHAARVHPTGRTDAIQLASDLTVWLFLTDDVYVEESGASNALSITADHVIRCIRVLRDPEDLPADPNASLLALQDISRRLRSWPTHEQVDRIVNGMLEYFSGRMLRGGLRFAEGAADGGRLHPAARLRSIACARSASCSLRSSAATNCPVLPGAAPICRPSSTRPPESFQTITTFFPDCASSPKTFR